MRTSRLLSVFLILLFFGSNLKATHNRAGEIIYTRIAPFYTVVAGETLPVYQYSITVIVYTDHGNQVADRCADTVYFGDGQRGIAYRINADSPPLTCACNGTVQCGDLIISSNGYNVKKNIYTITHRYPGTGNYLIYMYDPNRNAGVHNMQTSDQQPFYIESRLIINNVSGSNSSPIFTNEPIDRACLGKCFYHNPGAYDVDGDSLSFEITTSRGWGGTTVPGYFYPETGGGSFGINAVTGLLTWCNPIYNTEYNVAFIVYEWRKNTSGVREIIGSVLRDMQVVVKPCPNNDPPSIIVPADTCVEAGTIINKKIYVSDPQPQTVTLSGNGGAFAVVSPKAFLSPTIGMVDYSSNFVWQTTCDHIRQQPYQTVFKATDNYSVQSVFFATYNIRVVPPSVKNVTAVPIGSSIKVNWSLSPCSSNINPLRAYKIYRRDSCVVVPFTPCQTGAPLNSGFKYIGETSASTNQFIDDNGGKGLVVGRSYSYLVVADYQDGTQTFASAQVCTELKRDIPIILNVDVLSTSNTTGGIFIKWERPLTNSANLDTLVFTGPYEFKLDHRYTSSATFTTVYTSSSNFFLGLNTSFTHSNINTSDSGSEYLVTFLSGTTNVGNSPLATSVFLKTSPSDRKIRISWSSETPWINTLYKIYRKDPSSNTYSIVNTTTATAYTDANNIANKNTYCYKILSEGEYSDPGIFKPLLNNSQESCATAIDSTAPCTPTVSIDANCETGFVKVSWTNVQQLNCGDDVVSYQLFYKETIDGNYVKIYDGSSTSLTYDGLEIISGCYAVQAKDSTGNISQLSPDFCIENCPIFELPNVVTPNNDGINDFYKAVRVRQIKEINLRIYDRWGNIVYTTGDPYFQWNVISQFSNQPLSEGTFFYICDVYQPSLNGIVKRTLKSWMEVVR